MSRGRKIVWAISIVSIGAIASLFLLKYAERHLRANTSWAPPIIQIQRQARLLVEDRNAASIPDNDTGFSLAVNLEQDVETLDFSFVRSLDSHGFANSIDWPANAEIVVLGDSIAMAEGVGLDKGFASLISAAINDKTVINLAVPGAGVERQRRILERYDEELAPELIVVCLAIAYSFPNDIQFNAWIEDSLGKNYNDFRLSYNRRKSRERPADFMRYVEKRAVYQWSLSKIDGLLSGDRELEDRAVMSDGQPLQFDRAKTMLATREFLPGDPEILQFQVSVDRLLNLARTNSAGLVFVLLPSKEELFAVAADARPGNALSLVKRELAERNIEYLSMYDVLRRSEAVTTPYFERDIHFNEWGNQVIADAFVTWYGTRAPE